MPRLIFSLIILVELAAFLNRGGGPLLAHLVLTGVSFVALVALLFRRRIPGLKSRHFDWRFGRLHGLYFAFCGLVLISIVTGLTPQFGLSELVLFFNGGLWMLILTGLKLEDDDLNFFAWLILALGTASAVLGFLVYTTSPIARIAGTFVQVDQPQYAAFNAYANILLLLLPVALWQLMRSYAHRLAPWFLGGALSILFAAFILTFSRAAWLSGIVMVVFGGGWFWLRRRELGRLVDRKRLGRLIASLLVGVLLVALVQEARSRYFDATSIKDKALFQSGEGTDSATERLDYWRSALVLMGERPVLGGGILSFRYLYPQLQTRFGINEDHPHNIVLKVGVENGIPAMLLLLAFFVGTGAAALRYCWNKPTDPVFYLMLGAVGVLAHHLLDFNFIVANYTLFAVFLGIFLNRIRESFPPRFWLAPLALFLSGAAVFVGLHEAWYNRAFQSGRAALEVATETGDAQQLSRAVSQLEEAGKLWFERDRLDFLTDAYRASYLATGDPKWLKKEREALPSPFVEEVVDAAVYARLGELEELSVARGGFDGTLYPARTFYREAIEHDPMNELSHYYNYGRTWLDEFGELSGEVRAELVEVMRIYTEVLSRNKHFTLLTDNPRYGSMLYGLLGMAGEKETYDAIWREEVRKYTIQFGPLPQALSPEETVGSLGR